MDQSTRTHRAGFNCNKEFAVSKSMVTNGCTRFSESSDLGMGGGVGVVDIAVPSAADDLSVANDDCANRSFSEFQSALGASQRFLHPEFIGGGSLARPLGIDLRDRGMRSSWSLWAQESSADYSTEPGRDSAEQGGAEQRRVNTRAPKVLDHSQHGADNFWHDGVDYRWNHDPADGVGDRHRRHNQKKPHFRGQVMEIGLHDILCTGVRVKAGKSSGAESFLREFAGKWYAYRIMGMPSLLRKLFLVDLLQGLKVTFRYQDPKEIYTEQYPLERPQVAERYRGAPRLNVNPDTDETMCIACDLCALACPEHLIIVSSERNEKTRRKELTNFTYDLSRCMFCGLCEDACPTDALELTQDFELASYTRDGAIWDRETLEKGPQPTQYRR